MDKLALVLSLALAPAVAGCAVSSGDDEVITQTSVTAAEDGSFQIAVRTITRAEQIAAVEERVALEDRAADLANEGLAEASDAISKDSTCSPRSLWLFDGIEFKGNQLCLQGKGTADLTLFPCVVSTTTGTFTHVWARTIRSYWPGEEPGRLVSATGVERKFAPHGAKVPVADVVAHDAVWVVLDR